MILVDTSIWIAHLRVANLQLVRLLDDVQVVSHPFVIGELACGWLRRRAEVIGHLRRLPVLAPVSHGEALAFIDAHELAGRGIGWVDVHLLASARLARARFWTADKALAKVAASLGVAA